MADVQTRIDPRVQRSRATVLAAALEELADRGYGAFSIDGVARRSGVARSTIYRLWGDRTSLVSEAMEELNVQPGPRPAGDESPRERVVALIGHLASAMRGSPVADCLPAMVDGAERDPAVRRLHHAYNERRRSALTAAVASARDSGAAHPDVVPELAAQALAGAVIYRRLMTARPLTDAEVEPLVATVLGP
ncbi:MAG: TetR/AcrR family transcriptional regulator [Nocardioides sp.]